MKVITSQIYDFNFGKWYYDESTGFINLLSNENESLAIDSIDYIYLNEDLAEINKYNFERLLIDGMDESSSKKEVFIFKWVYHARIGL
ncbi:MAG: hypothetical protein LW832_00170 [Parachlamydia sp.]|jgi:hypothetical protein|nr:hypothetical protein [Parachlamydia sp.]